MKKILSLLLVFIYILVQTNVQADSLKGQPAFHNVVIFIKFSDEEEYTSPYTLDFYEELFNSTSNPSLKGYYDEVSYNQLDVTTILPSENNTIIFYEDQYPRSYYQPYSESNTNGYLETQQRIREHSLLKNAIDYIDDLEIINPLINLDTNNDGEIDSLTFLISGDRTEWNTLLWPHKWDLYTYHNGTTFIADAPRINGVGAYTYTLELMGNTQGDDSNTSLGTVAHEMFHLLGAPDLYHYYSDDWMTPVGFWDVMESTMDLPQHMLGYMRYQYGGWIDEIEEITTSGTYQLDPIRLDGSNIYKYDTGYSNEYIYFEYRDDLGEYDSSIPNNGLIVYRVDEDYLNQGNRFGYYNSDMEGINEVFVYRPGMDDVTEPIIMTETTSGNINEAAFGQTIHNIGVGTEVPLFHSDGTIINIEISNITINEGHVTFDIIIPIHVRLQTKADNIDLKNAVLYDNDDMNYTVIIEGLHSTENVYIDYNEVIPDQSYSEYTGGDILIDNSKYQLNIAVYENNELAYVKTIPINYTDTIQTDHPYGENFVKHWYLDYDSFEQLHFQFAYESILANDDYVEIETREGIVTYDRDDLRDLAFDVYTDYVRISIYSGEKAYFTNYGFLVNILKIDKVEMYIEGDKTVEVEVFDTYTELGVNIFNNDLGAFSYEIIGEVNTNVIGEYILTYQLIDGLGNIELEQTRTVIVKDTVAPFGELVGDYEVTIEAGSVYEDAGITYSDNYSTELTISETTSLDETNKIGTFSYVYIVTDESGNSTEVRRLVHIIDTTPAIPLLLAGVDTIHVGEEWIDAGASGIDLISLSFTYTTEDVVDTGTPGVYIINYTVYDSAGNQSYISRYVTVVEVLSPEFICDSMTTSYQVGQDVTLTSCFVNDTELLGTHVIDNAIPGTYTIDYQIIINGEVYIYKRYIYLFELTSRVDTYYDFRRYDV